MTNSAAASATAPTFGITKPATAHILPVVRPVPAQSVFWLFARRDKGPCVSVKSYPMVKSEAVLPPPTARWGRLSTPISISPLGNAEWLIGHYGRGLRKQYRICLGARWMGCQSRRSDERAFNTILTMSILRPQPPLRRLLPGCVASLRGNGARGGRLRFRLLECRRLFASGSQWIDTNLFNGEYYEQQIRSFHNSEIANSLRSDMGADDPEHPEYQVGKGCLVDQLLGQSLAEVLRSRPTAQTQKYPPHSSNPSIDTTSRTPGSRT